MSSEITNRNELKEFQDGMEHSANELNQQDMKDTLDKVLDFREIPLTYEPPKISRLSFGSSCTTA